MMSGTLTGGSPFAADSWLAEKKIGKKKKREKISLYNSQGILFLQNYLPCPLHWHCLKKTQLFFFCFCFCNISLALFFNRTMNFMGLSTGLTAYEELPRNTRRLFCSLPHVSERSQNNNRVIKMTFTHSLIIIYLFFPFCAVMRAIYFMPH